MIKPITLETPVGWHQDGTDLLAGHLMPGAFRQLRMAEVLYRAVCQAERLFGAGEVIGAEDVAMIAEQIREAKRQAEE